MSKEDLCEECLEDLGVVIADRLYKHTHCHHPKELVTVECKDCHDQDILNNWKIWDYRYCHYCGRPLGE